MVSSFVQLKSILWKNWLLKKAHFSGFLAEILLPVLFMALLIMIKGLTSVYDSPNIAYFCGNTYPWFYSSTFDSDQFYSADSPMSCLEKPAECTTRNYYKDSATFTLNGSSDLITAYSQYGYITSSASSGQAENPFYAFTIADTSSMYYIETDDFTMDNPSLPMCAILYRITYARRPAILALAPVTSTDAALTQQTLTLRQYLIDTCIHQMGFDFGRSVRLFDSQSEVESYIKDKHYDDTDYGYGKVAFSIILNAVDTTAVQWDYSIRANYTSIWNQGDHTVACLYGGYKGCDFTYTVPSTKFNTQDLFKPQSSEYLYGYTYSGFATLQQAVDQFIFAVQAHNAVTDSAGSEGAGVNNAGTSAAANVERHPLTRKLDASVESAQIDQSPNINAQEPPLYPTYRTDASTTSATTALPGYVSIMASVGLMPTGSYKTDDFQYIISSTLGIFYMLSFLYPVSRIIRALVLEKETRIKEGMKMMGLTDSVYNLSWLITTLLQMTFVSILITLVTASSVFEYSNKVYVFIYFEAFSLAVINMCFLLSTMFSRSKSASLLGPMIFFASFFPYYAVNDDQFDSSAKAATCILAPACFALGAEVFADYEGGLVGVQSSNTNLETSNFTYNLCVGMMFFDAVLYGVLAWYLDNVLPSEYGTQLPLYFPLLPSYWFGLSSISDTWYGALCGMCMRKQKYSIVGQDEGLETGLLSTHAAEQGAGAANAHKNEYIEPVAADLLRQAVTQTCLTISDLRKVFTSAAGGSDRVAVDKLNMSLYQGQVTVLLGHNGAGKTTTISMLVGLLPPTSGNAYFPGGLSIVDDMHEIRRNLGVCPQHDILFPELTVMQHLQIYASFKGVPSSEVYSAAKSMLAEVGLSEKAHARSSTLSGGQKRKLSLGIALIGDSKVVILDEPTSGMDPYSRRSTWNIIQRNKKGRIILLTTHFMDEADLLGDRVAIMAHGKLQCFGSPLFLKNKFGVGYTLTVVKHQHVSGPASGAEADADGHSGAASESHDHTHSHAPSFVEMSKRLDSLVASFIPEAEPLSDVGAEQSFRLPFAASGRFVELFTAFDEQKEALGIAEYGISVTTLEEVFIRVGELEESLNEVPPEIPRYMSDESDGPSLSQQGRLSLAAAAEAGPLKGAHFAHSTPSASTTAGEEPRNSEDAHNPILRTRSSESSHPPHGILHTDHHHTHRLHSTSSEHMHKHVSFRDSDEDNSMQLLAAQAVSVLPSQVTQKVETELHVDKVVPPTHEPHTAQSHTDDSLHFEEHVASASGAPHSGGLFCTHFSALLVKRAIYAKRDRRMIFCQLILPVLLVVLGVSILLIKPNLNQPNLILTAGKFNGEMSAEYRNFVPFSTDGADADSFPQKIMSRFNGNEDNGTYGVAVPVQDLGGEDSFASCAQGASVLYEMSQYVLKSLDDASVDVEDGSSRYGAVTIANNTNEFNLNYNILVNGSAIHGVGVFVNLVHQAYLQVVTDTPTAKITVHNYPLPETYKQKNDAATADAFVVALFAMIAFCFIPASFAVFVVKEREVKAKHQQVISGVSIYAYWTSTYLWDVVSYLPTAALVIIVMYIYDVRAYTVGSSAAAFAMLFLLYGPATAAITYLVSFIFVSHSTAQIVVMFFNFITGLCLMVVSFVLTTIPTTTELNLSLRYVFRLFPSFCLGDGIIQLALCTDGTSCPTIDRNGYNFDKTQSPLAWDIAGADMVFLAWHAVVYFALAVLIEYGLTFPALLSWLYDVEDDERDIQDLKHLHLNPDNGAGSTSATDRLLGAGSATTTVTPIEDEDVLTERRRVLSGAADNEVVRIQELRKIYPANSKAGGIDPLAIFRVALRKSWRAISASVGADTNTGASGVKATGQKNYKVAVQSLCFGIPKGQCFGFLGINGAGKTTTLSILSGEFPPTSGEAYIDGFSIRDDQTNIRRRIGYCPQFDALLELLTVREHLELYGRIKGFRGAGLEAIVRGKLVQLDLKDFEHKTAGSLSGGNKRKLSVAVATIGEPSIVFLDEPSTGMDPVARRFMWKVIARMTAEDAQCSVILTTHSMEEAEALCSRIGVMVNGRLRCLGPAQHLKLRFGNGFEVNIKLSALSPEVMYRTMQAALLQIRTPSITAATATTERKSFLGRLSADGLRNSFSGPPLTQPGDVMSPLESLAALPNAEAQTIASAAAGAVSGLDALDSLTLKRAHLHRVCDGLGKPGRVSLIAPFQSGAMLHDSFLAEGEEIPLRMFLEWWLYEDLAERLQQFMCEQFGARAQLLERSTAQHFRYRVQLQSADETEGAAEPGVSAGASEASGAGHAQNALSDIFARFEAHKSALHILEYSVGQTTLEQIFNQFASQQDNPEVQAANEAAATASTLHAK